MNSRIKKNIITIIKSFPIAFVIICLSSCSSGGKTVTVNKTSGFQQSHGPFDSNGNYVENWADQAPKRTFTWNRSAKKKPTPPQSTSKSVSIARNTTPKKVYTTPETTAPRKATKKSTAKKITPKTKPPIYHSVVKGNTLYGLARQYGTSVSAIQKANRINGSNISIGKRLIIPRK